MKAAQLFKKIEDRIPLEIALNGDIVGFLGSEETLNKDIKKVLVLMDYFPQKYLNTDLKKSKNGKNINYYDFDLLILHHPPFYCPHRRESEALIKKSLREFIPEQAMYVIHSNWDIMEGGACDALADCLDIEINEVLDPQTGIGRIGKIKNGPVNFNEFTHDVIRRLSLDEVKTVNNDNSMIETVALVSGFGLNPSFIKIAHEKGAEAYLSGDLTHPGAILAKNLGIKLIDVSHHVSELPGLYRLGKLVSELGVEVQVLDTEIPWKTYSLK